MVFAYAPAGGGGDLSDPNINTASICHAKYLAEQAGFSGADVNTIVAIAMAESGLRYYVWGGPNTNGSYDRGILQINDIHTSVSDLAAMSGATSATSGPSATYILQPWLFARQLVNGRINIGRPPFEDWSVYNNGAYLTYLSQVQSTSCSGGNYAAVAAGASPAVRSVQPNTNGTDTVGQNNDGFDVYCYQTFHGFNTSNIGAAGGTVDGSGHGFSVRAASDNTSGGDFTMEVRRFDWSGSTPAAADFRSGAQLAALPLMAAYNLNGGFSSGTRYQFADNGVGPQVNRTGTTKVVVSSSNQRLGLAPGGSESATYYMGDASGGPELYVGWTTPNSNPIYTSLPSVSYGGGLTKTGPSNPLWTVSWRATDAEQTGGNQLNYSVVTLVSGVESQTVASGTFTSGVTHGVAIAYNAGNIPNGVSSLRLKINDGVVGSLNTADFTLDREDEAPAISAVTTSPATVVGPAYNVVFTPTDARSTGAGQLTYWVFTGPGATGNQLASGTATSGQQVTANVNDPGYAGATRYVRVRNAAGAITERSAVIASNTAPTFTSAPVVLYGAGLLATGPSSGFQVRFTATDAEQTGGGQLSYRVLNQVGSTIVGPVAFTAGAQQTSASIPYSSVSADGVNGGWSVQVSDGTSTATSSFPVRRDSIAPSAGSPTLVSSPVVGTSYQVRFTPTDTGSTGANELSWTIATGVGGAGTLSSGTVTAGTQVTASVSDPSLTNGATRYVRVVDTAGNSAEVAIVVPRTTAPGFSVQPSVSYGSGFTRAGPRNQSFFVTFTATDAESGSLSYRLINASSQQVQAGAAAVGSPTTVTVAWNAVGVASGAPQLRVELSDGTLTTTSSAFTVLTDPSPPTASTSVSVSPSPVTSQTGPYQVTFTPNDAAPSPQAGEMYYQVNTQSVAGTGPGPGDLKGGPSGFSCTSGTPVTTSNITDSLVDGQNARYVRVRDGAGQWSETLVSVTADLSDPVVLTGLAAPGASSTIVMLNANAQLQLLLDTESSTDLGLIISRLFTFVVEGISTVSIQLSSIQLLGELASHGPAGTDATVSTSVPVPAEVPAGAPGATLAPLSAATYVLLAIDGVSSVAGNLDATLKPTLLTPTADGVSSTAASLALTPIVVFLTISVTGESTGGGNMHATPKVAFLTLAADGVSTVPALPFGATPGPDLIQAIVPASASSSTTLVVAAPAILQPSPTAASTASLELMIGRTSMPPLPIEALGVMKSDGMAPVESYGPVAAVGALGLEYSWMVAGTAVVDLAVRGWVLPALTAGLEWAAQLRNTVTSNLEWRAQMATSAVLPTEVLSEASRRLPVVMEAFGVVGGLSAAVVENLSRVVNFAGNSSTGFLDVNIETLQVSVQVQDEVDIEHLVEATGTATAPVEVTLFAATPEAEVPIETLKSVSVSAVLSVEALTRPIASAAVNVEAEGYVLDKGPDDSDNLIVKRRVDIEDLRPRRAGITIKQFKY